MDPLLEMAIDLVDHGEHLEALAAFDAFLEGTPDHPQALHESAMVLLELGRLDEAIARHERLMAVEPTFPGAREWLARSYGRAGRHADAAACQKAHLRAAPEGPPGMGVSPNAWNDCAEYYLAAGEARAAQALLEEYFAEHERGVTAYACHATAPMRTLSALLSARGEHERATELARRAFDHEHREPVDIANWIRVAARAGASSEARRAWHDFRASPYWEGHEAHPEMVALHDELEALVG